MLFAKRYRNTFVCLKRRQLTALLLCYQSYPQFLHLNCLFTFCDSDFAFWRLVIFSIEVEPMVGQRGMCMMSLCVGGDILTPSSQNTRCSFQRYNNDQTKLDIINLELLFFLPSKSRTALSDYPANKTPRKAPCTCPSSE